ncbi:hypothetical protein Dimus_020799 [Dionaea muscipula]
MAVGGGSEEGDTNDKRQSASRITVVAHFFGILAIILMLVWLLHFCGDIDLDSDVPAHVFNVDILFDPSS